MGPGIRSNNRRGLWLMWLFTAAWTAITSLVLYQVFFQEQNFETTHRVMALVFLVSSAGLLASCAYASWTMLRFGRTSIGGQVGGSLDIHYSFPQNQLFSVALSCVKSRVSGSGKNRRRSESVTWQTDGGCSVERIPGGARLSFRFDVPPGLPATSPVRAGDYFLWRVSISADLDGPDFGRSFDIPVEAGRH